MAVARGHDIAPAAAVEERVDLERRRAEKSAGVGRDRRAIGGGGTRWGVTAIVAGAGIVVAALAIIPFVGFALVILAAWLGIRSRRDDQTKYGGLRVLR